MGMKNHKSVSINREVHAIIAKLAEEEGRSVANMTEIIVKRYVSNSR
jgi:hypothetical protein